MSKIKLSDTLRFVSSRLNKITGGEVEITLKLEDQTIAPGGELRAEARVRSPGKQRQMDYLLVSLRGQVQREGKWQDYAHRAEAFHDALLPADHEYIVPFRIQIPADAVLTEDGGKWSLRGQAVIDRAIDPRIEVPFAVAGDVVVALVKDDEEAGVTH